MITIVKVKVAVPFSEMEDTEGEQLAGGGGDDSVFKTVEFRMFLDHLRACASNRHLNMSI